MPFKKKIDDEGLTWYTLYYYPKGSMNDWTDKITLGRTRALSDTDAVSVALKIAHKKGMLVLKQYVAALPDF